MKPLPILALTVAALWAGSALAETPAVSGAFAQIDRSFVCPESLPSDEARMAAVESFVTQVQLAEPGKTIPQTLALRYQLLEKHGCTATLANLQGDRTVARGANTAAAHGA